MTATVQEAGLTRVFDAGDGSCIGALLTDRRPERQTDKARPAAYPGVQYLKDHIGPATPVRAAPLPVSDTGRMTTGRGVVAAGGMRTTG